MMRVDLGVDLCGVRLRNPLVLASGVLGTEAALLERVAGCGAGAVTTKSCSVHPRPGHPNPSVLDWGPGLINAVGLANPGVEAELEVIGRVKDRLARLGVALIVSVFGETVAQFREVAERVSVMCPDMIEVNISCPNVASEGGRPFALDVRDAAEVTKAVRSVTSLPITVKLSPNTYDLVSIAQAVVNAGADALTAINTVGPGMIVDVESGWPILGNREGGVSGPAIRPIAVRCVYDLVAAVDVPVIGVGGVTTPRDVIEMVMVGATAVGVGSAVYFDGPDIFDSLAVGIRSWLQNHGYRSLTEVRGISHER
jgi:dihydroorotate dehydrogenase (NAD+) catalytic subunit